MLISPPTFKNIGNQEIGIVKIPVLGGLRIDEHLYIEERKPYTTRQIIESEARNHSALTDNLVESYNLLLGALRGDLGPEQIDTRLEKTIESLSRKLSRASQRVTDVYAAAILKYRLKQKDLTLKDIQLCQGIHPKLVEAIANFAREESLGGKAPESDDFVDVHSREEIASLSHVPDPPDWGDLMLRLGRIFPYMPVFASPEQFVTKPIPWCYEMLDAGMRLYREDLHLQELAIAHLHADFVRANSKHPNQIKTEDYYLFKPQDTLDLKLSPTICNIFFSLSSDEILPQWGHTYELVRQMRKYQSEDPVHYPRAFIGENVYMIAPKRSQESVKAAFMGVQKHEEKIVELRDPDTGQTIKIDLSQYDEGFFIDEVIPLQS